MSATGQRRDSFFSFSLLILALIFIWIFRFFGPDFTRPWFAPVPIEAPVDLLLLCAAVLAALLLHECGHLLAALLLGFRILGGSVGPLQIQVLHGTWKFFWSRRAFFTGSVSAVPGSMTHWRGAMLTVVAAGPFATLLSGVLAAALQPAGHSLLLLQLAFVQVSLLLFFLGLIPNRSQARQHNDARLLLDLARGNQGADEMELRVLLKQHVLSGDRPQDYPPELIRRLATFEGRAESRMLFAQALVQWAIDSDQQHVADDWDMRALALVEECGPRMQNSARAASACFDVLFRSDLESARHKFERVEMSALFPVCLEHRARAAQQIALGRSHRAPAHILRAQYALPRGVAAYDLERKLLENLHMQVLNGSSIQRAKAHAASA